MEFIAGVLASLYFVGLVYLVHDTRPSIGSIPLYVLWPITLAVSPITRAIFKRWKYERRPLEEYSWDDGSGYGWYLKKNRKPNDSWGWAELAGWIKRMIRRIR
jgi:hypothetical protein